MLNLAGSKDSDIHCAAELTTAGIEIVPVEKPYGEPQTKLTGKLGGITFRRAWYYWAATGRVPLDVARRLYEDPIGRRDVRVAGFAGNTPPEPPWVEYFDGDVMVILDPDGQEEAEWDRLAKKGLLRSISKPRFAKTTDGLQGYITTYHIDTAEGLRLFADAVRKQ